MMEGLSATLDARNPHAVDAAGGMVVTCARGSDVSKHTRPRSTVNSDQLDLLSVPIAWVIYVLADPRVEDPIQRIRYVGITSQVPATRYRQHISYARKGDGNTHKDNWIRQLLKEGLKPIFEIIDPGTGLREWDGSEKAWIQHYRAAGCPLTNNTDGGEGNAGWIPSQETREKMSSSAVARMSDPKQREHLSKINTGKVYSAESRAKQSAALTGIKKSAETRAKMSRAQKNRVLSSEAKESITSSARAFAVTRFSDPEERKKSSEKMIALWQDEEYRAMQSASRKSRPKKGARK